VLIKSILEIIPMFWPSIAHVPKSILNKITRKCCSFLWTRSKQKEGNPIGEMVNFGRAQISEWLRF